MIASEDQERVSGAQPCGQTPEEAGVALDSQQESENRFVVLSLESESLFAAEGLSFGGEPLP